MVALQFLELSVQVRILVSQHKKATVFTAAFLVEIPLVEIPLLTPAASQLPQGHCSSHTVTLVPKKRTLETKKPDFVPFVPQKWTLEARAFFKGPYRRGLLHHTAHSACRHRRHRRILLFLLGNHALGSQEHTGHACSILQSDTRNLGRIYNAT